MCVRVHSCMRLNTISGSVFVCLGVYVNIKIKQIFSGAFQVNRFHDGMTTPIYRLNLNVFFVNTPISP